MHQVKAFLTEQKIRGTDILAVDSAEHPSLTYFVCPGDNRIGISGRGDGRNIAVLTQGMVKAIMTGEAMEILKMYGKA